LLDAKSAARTGKPEFGKGKDLPMNDFTEQERQVLASVMHEIGRRGGLHRSARKAESSRQNGKLGGRPKKDSRNPPRIRLEPPGIPLEQPATAVPIAPKITWEVRMKREANEGEAFLSHHTTNTGHTRRFALTWQNYDPRAIRVAQRMLGTGETVGGFYLKALPPGLDPDGHMDPRRGFEVLLPGTAPITTNRVMVTDAGILLSTSILYAANDVVNEQDPNAPDIMAAAADLEQCAALAMAFSDNPQVYERFID
jgi:hypothetical protein